MSKLRVKVSTIDYKQAALELNAEVRNALSWIETDGEPNVAYSALRRVHEKWEQEFQNE